MRWSQTDICRLACKAVKVQYADYMDALRYIFDAGPVRGAVAIKTLALRLRA